MVHVRASVAAKLNRAAEHLAAFDMEARTWGERQAYSLTREVDSDGTQYVWKVHGIKPVPDRLAVLAGDCLHNLRSALDHLVFALSDPTNRSRSEFPILDARKSWAALDKSGSLKGSSGVFKVRGMAPDHQAIVEQLQPYHGWDRDDTEDLERRLLRVIQKLDIIDKHRRLNIVTTVVEDISHSWGPDESGPRFEFTSGGLKDDAVVLTATFPKPEPGVHMGLDIAFGIAFAEEELGRTENAPLALWMGHQRVETIAGLLGVRDLVDPPPVPCHWFTTVQG